MTVGGEDAHHLVVGVSRRVLGALVRILSTWSVALVAVLLLGAVPGGQLGVCLVDELGRKRDIGQLPLPGIGGLGGGWHGLSDVLVHGDGADRAGRLGKFGHHLRNVGVHGGVRVEKRREGRNGGVWREGAGVYIVVVLFSRRQGCGCEILDAKLGNGQLSLSPVVVEAVLVLVSAGGAAEDMRQFEGGDA